MFSAWGNRDIRLGCSDFFRFNPFSVLIHILEEGFSVFFCWIKCWGGPRNARNLPLQLVILGKDYLCLAELTNADPLRAGCRTESLKKQFCIHSDRPTTVWSTQLDKWWAWWKTDADTENVVAVRWGSNVATTWLRCSALQDVQILTAFRFWITSPHSTQQSFHFQACRCSRAAILPWAVQGGRESGKNCVLWISNEVTKSW